MNKVVPSYLNCSVDKPLSSIQIYVKGKSFLRIRNLYLSGSNDQMFDFFTLHDPFSASPRLHVKYPAFRGVVVPEFTVESDNLITFQMPEHADTVGYIDIIAENEAGYGSLVIDTQNRNISATQEEIPWINGIWVKTVAVGWFTSPDLEQLITDQGENLYVTLD